MTSERYQIDGFPEDEDFWRIELFGGISFNPRVPSEHLIEVALARVSPDSGNKINSKHLAFRRNVREVVQVGIGYLPYLALGTIWQDRRPSDRKLSIPEQTFQIDVGTQAFISTDGWIDEGWVIAKNKYAFGDNWCIAKDTKLVAVKYGGDPYGLLIPALELFRFYYATSTDLAKAACWGEFQNAYDSEQSGLQSDGNCKVHLRQHVSKNEAWTLARYITSPVMQHQLEQFHRKIQTTQINAGANPVTPNRALECGFPFSGKASIRGLAINVSDKTTPRWLILRLTGCAHPLPFGDVVVAEDDTHTDGQEGVIDEGLPGAMKYIPSPGKKEQTDIFRSDAEPSLKLKPLEIQLPEDRFDGLKGKKLITPPAGARKNTAVQVVSTSTKTTDGFGSGDGTWGESDRKRIKLHNVPEEEKPTKPPKMKLPVNLENFMDAMRLLRKKHNFQGSFIGTSNKDIRDGDSIFATFPRSKPGSKRPLKWPFLSNGLPRRMVIAQIVINKKIVYAMEIERNVETEHYSTQVIALQSFEAFSKADWEKFMLQCAIKNRWSKTAENKILRRATTTHKDLVGVDVFADRIWRCVMEVLGGEGEDAGK